MLWEWTAMDDWVLMAGPVGFEPTVAGSPRSHLCHAERRRLTRNSRGEKFLSVLSGLDYGPLRIRSLLNRIYPCA